MHNGSGIFGAAFWRRLYSDTDKWVQSKIKYFEVYPNYKSDLAKLQVVAFRDVQTGGDGLQAQHGRGKYNGPTSTENL